MSPDRHFVELHCPKCGAKGAAVWEKVGAQNMRVELTGNFYERIPKRDRSKIELACHACGAQVPE